MFVGANVWDPALIIAQIVSMQFLYYLAMGLLQLIALGPFVSRLSVSYMFDWHTLHLSNKPGWVNVCVHLGAAGVAAVIMMAVVERAKKCLDFSATLYIWHLVFVWHYSGWPHSVVWWLTEGSAFAMLALFSEWLCIQRELQDIPLPGLAALARATSGRSKEPTSAALEDSELLPLRARARGTARGAAASGSASMSGGSGPSGMAAGSAGGGVAAAGGGAASSGGSVVVQLASVMRGIPSFVGREGPPGGGQARRLTPRGDIGV